MRGVDFKRDDVTVVDVLDEPGFESASTPAALKITELIAQVCEDRYFFLSHGGRGLAGSVKFFEVPAGAVDFPIELAAPDQTLFVVPQIHVAALMTQPALDALLGDDVGERFIEDRVAPVEDLAMGEFVECQVLAFRENSGAA